MLASASRWPNRRWRVRERRPRFCLHDLSLLQDRNTLLAIMKDGQFHKSFQGRVAVGQAMAAE